MTNNVTPYFLTAVLACASLGAASPETRVVDAAAQRDGLAVTALLKAGADVNATQADGAAALHWAAHWNDVPLAKRLLAAGARVDTANDYGVTPLFLAASNGGAEMVGVLLDAGAAATATLPTGETVLMTAVRGGNPAVVKRLLAKGASPNASQTSKGQTALMWAATRQQVDIVQALLEAGADVRARSKAGFTPLHFAAREGSVDVARLLLAAKADANEYAPDGSTPVLIATVRGHVDLALFFLEKGAAPDGHINAGYTPLHWAAGEYETTPITYNEIEPPGEWRALAGIPDRTKKFELVTALLAKGADINAVAWKPIVRMAPFGGGARVPTHAGVTAFFTAAASADAEMMRFLLERGADASIVSYEGFTPLMAAAEGIVEDAIRLNEERRTAALDVAIAAGNDLHAYNFRGWQAIHVATRAGFHKVVKFLIDKGVDMNALTQPRPSRDYKVPAQSPRGLAEGTLDGLFLERPDTAAFLGSLGAKSIGAVNQNEIEENIRKKNKPVAAR